MPVEAKVAAIFRATWPDLPKPVTMMAMAGLPGASGAAANELDGLLELGSELVGKRIERARFVVEDRPAELEDSDRGTAVCCHAAISSHALTACEA